MCEFKVGDWVISNNQALKVEAIDNELEFLIEQSSISNI